MSSSLPVIPTASATNRRLISYLKPYKGKFAFALGAMTIYGATDGGVPILIQSVLDDIFGSHNTTMLYVLPVALIIFAAIRGLFGFIQRYYMASIGLAIIEDMRNQISDHLMSLSPAFYGRHTSGTLLSRMTNDTLQVKVALTESVTSLLRDSIRVLALFVTALWLDPILALIAFVGFPFGLYPVIRFGKKVRRLSRVGQEQFGGLTSLLQEMVLGHKVVQSFCMEEQEKKRFRAENSILTRTFKKAEKYGALSGPTNEFVASLAISAIIIYGGLSVVNGVRTQGDFIAFLTAMFLLYEPVKKLGRINAGLQAGSAAADRIFEILDTKSEVYDMPGARELVTSDYSVRFEDVYFAYPGTWRAATTESAAKEKWTLDNISLHLPHGQTLALVGESGGGKSTVASLLLRFFDPQLGRITVGGHDIRELTLESLRSRISYVSQNTFLFNDSIYNNIAYGRPGVSREEVIAAAHAASAHNFIMQLPDGYDTSVGEHGTSLSGGERARVAIARALLKDAPILILDEATAALDSESEKAVQGAIDTLMAGRTVIVIAHRLATIRKADSIAVIVSGRVVEQGTHEELLARGGVFEKLHSIQFAA
ncbi:MAG: ABC transporter transmembrane domain-containing protein [bacterium]|nr:ABC transporter transmembrane domain-containing protein [bacterium]